MGWVWTFLLNGGLGLGAYWAARFGLRQPSGFPRILAAVVLAWSWLTIGMETLGAFGLLSRGPLLGWVVAGILIGPACKLSARSSEKAEVAGSTDRPFSWEQLLCFGLVLWSAFLRGIASLYGPVKVVSDGPIYHLYFAIRWWKAGRLDLIATPFGENAATYFPAGGDLWFCWLIIGWGNELLAKVGQVPFLAVTGMTIFALCRRLGASRPSSAIATAWALLTTLMLIFAFEPNVDTIFSAGYLLAAYFFLRHALGDDGPAGLALGGLAAGCALGTKAPAFVFVVPLLALALVSALRQGRTAPAKLFGGLIVLFAPLAVAGFWYARNIALTGNPLYPLHLAGFGRVWLAGWYGPEVMRSSQYYLPAGDWRAFVDCVLSVLDPRLAPVWLAALLGVWAWKLKFRSNVDGWVWVASGLAVANVLLFWFVIPYRTQLRFLIQALGLAAIPLARTIDRAVWVRFIVIVLLLIHVFTNHGWPFSDGNPPWDLSSDVPNNSPSALPVPAFTTTGYLSRYARMFYVYGLASFAIVGAIGWALKSPTVRRRTLSVITVLIITSGLFAISYPWTTKPIPQFYPRFPEFYRGWLALDSRAGASGARVAYAGTNLPYYLQGVNLRNEVRYVNLDAHPGRLMHDYHLEAVRSGSGPKTWNLPRPGWDRAHPDYRAWVNNLRAERIEFLVITRVNPQELLDGINEATGFFPIERTWADSHPETFEILYGRNPPDPAFRLYRVKPATETPR